jgi:DNA helicase IV
MYEVKSAVSEVIYCDSELEKQLKNLKLKKALEFLIIGFLIFKDIDKMILQLRNKRKRALDRISNRFKEIENINIQLEEMYRATIILGPIERSQLISSIENLVEDLCVLRENNILGEQEYRNKLAKCAEKIVLQEKESLCRKIAHLVSSNTYLDYERKKELQDALNSYENNLLFFKRSGIIDPLFLVEARQDLQKDKEFITVYNYNFVEKRKIEYSYLFKTKSLCLDEEQKEAIIKDDKHNLVVAAAGSGKTEVLATRIAYLVKQNPGSIDPSRILAIAFQDKAREEIAKRVMDNFGIAGVNIRTFHTLGKGIVEKHRGRTFIHNEILEDSHKLLEIKKIYARKLQDSSFYNHFLDYLRLHNAIYVDSSEKDDNLAKKLASKYLSINNTPVKSLAEKEIMDLFLSHKINGRKIEIEYEPFFEEYEPDFRLTDFDLYIEHWGINEEGQTPKHFSITPEQYRAKMEKEKALFEQQKKLFVETFDYEFDRKNPETFVNKVKERVLEKLREKYSKELELTQMTYDELVQVAWSSYEDPTPQNISNFIKNAKVYGLTSDRIEEKIKRGEWTPKQRAFTALALDVYREYERYLVESGKIDFEDMINKAIECLKQDSSLYYDVYDHILIDEYQDISAQRNRLIENLLVRNPKCKLFCVGDDWQSIMAFAGSNVNLFLNFKDYFPNPEIQKIQTNYRSQSIIVDAGSALIANNGRNQIQKIIRSNKCTGKKIILVSSDHQDKKYEPRYFEQIAQDCVSRISTLIANGAAPNDILVLSRFITKAYVIDIFREKAKEKGLFLPEKNERLKKNQIRLMSVHGSKGQQAKYVFILNVIKDRYGFPCEIEDNSILQPARENYPKQDQRQEERRLFYVALTRAKEEIVIYTWDLFLSDFVKEITPFIEWETLHYWT